MSYSSNYSQPEDDKSVDFNRDKQVIGRTQKHKDPKMLTTTGIFAQKDKASTLMSVMIMTSSSNKGIETEELE